MYLYAEKTNTSTWRDILRGLLLQDRSWRSSRCSLHWRQRESQTGILYHQLAVSNIIRSRDQFVMLPTPNASDGTRGSTRRPTIINGRPTNYSTKGVKYGLSIRQLVEHRHYPTEALYRRNGWEKHDIHEKAWISPAFLCELMGYPSNWLSIPFIKAKTVNQ